MVQLCCLMDVMNEISLVHVEMNLFIYIYAYMYIYITCSIWHFKLLILEWGTFRCYHIFSFRSCTNVFAQNNMQFVPLYI